MVFDNTISIADIISILGLTLSFITIIFLFIQRKDSSRIYLSIKDDKPSHKFKNNRHVEETLFIKLLGNSVARNIKLKYKLVSDKIQITNNIYRSAKGDTLICIKNDEYFDNICQEDNLNISQSLHGIMYAILDDILMLLPSFKYKDKIDVNINYVLIEISYQDINGYTYYQYYKIDVKVTAMDFFKNEFDYSINIEEVNKKNYKKILNYKSL